VTAHRTRPFIALLLLAAHLWLPLFAYADPPDDAWGIPSVFDDADSDDIVLVVMGMTGIVVSGPILAVTIEPAFDAVPVVEPAVRPEAARRSLPIRAPPSA
jgi:hypothetical protein